ncbi:hypothetical protein HYV83_01305 [Candidatus Woesearchaeota archaeon]|nr:hypothetical protein [Candidatus Woesearchaeota archaeon]
MRLNLLMVFAIAAAAVVPQLVSAHLLDGNKGPVDAFNYDEGQLKHLDSDCAASFECKPNDVNGVYFYNCHYDVYSSECQCLKGEFSKCDAAKSSLGAAAVATGGIGGVFDAVKVTVKTAFGLFDSLPALAKVAILAIVAAAAVFAFSRLRSTASNNLRRAREFHEQATLLHEAGDEEEAKLLLERSNYHREKAYEQMRQQNPFAEKGLSKTGK